MIFHSLYCVLYTTHCQENNFFTFTNWIYLELTVLKQLKFLCTALVLLLWKPSPTIQTVFHWIITSENLCFVIRFATLIMADPGFGFFNDGMCCDRRRGSKGISRELRTFVCLSRVHNPRLITQNLLECADGSSASIVLYVFTRFKFTLTWKNTRNELKKRHQCFLRKTSNGS